MFRASSIKPPKNWVGLSTKLLYFIKNLCPNVQKRTITPPSFITTHLLHRIANAIVNNSNPEEKSFWEKLFYLGIYPVVELALIRLDATVFVFSLTLTQAEIERAEDMRHVRRIEICWHDVWILIRSSVSLVWLINFF